MKRALAALSMVLVFAGCPIPIPIPVPSPSPSPTSTPTPSPNPTPTPAPVPTPLPACQPFIYGASLGLIPPTRIAAVDEALRRVHLFRPELFTAADPNVLSAQGAAAHAKAFFLAVQAALLEDGICSEVFDEIQVLGVGGAHSEGYRLVNFGGLRVFDAANAYKFGSVRVELAPPGPGPTPTPLPQPSPVPSPTPSPSPTPGGGGCAATRADVEFWRNIVKPHGLNQQLDFTIVACGPIRDIINNGKCLAACCELSAEKGFKECGDALFGEPQVTGSGDLILVPIVRWTTFKVASGIGVITICGADTGKPGNCVQVDAFAEVPACTLQAGSNQGCVIR